MKAKIEIFSPEQKHPGGPFWVNELIQDLKNGLAKLDEVKPYLHRVRVDDIRKSSANHKTGWKAGDVMEGYVNDKDEDYGYYLLF